MRQLFLIRHAKSDWGHPGLDDFDRPLNARGRRDAPVMVKRLKQAGHRPDRLIASPARRARDTAEIFREATGYPPDAVQWDRRIYDASLEDLLRVIGELAENCAHAWLFGHNPGLNELARWLTGQPLENIPTCGVYAVELPGRAWANPAPGRGACLFFDYPKNPEA